MKNKYKHSHPINIIEHTSRFLILLIFPVLRALIFSKFDLYIWLKGVWFDLIIIAVIISFGIWAWIRYVYFLDESGIYIKKGIVFPKTRYIPYENLSVVSVEKTFYLIPFNAVRFRADTDGGFPNIADFEITIRKKSLDEIILKCNKPFISYNDIKRVYLPKNFYIAILSFIASNTLTGVIFVSTLITGLGKVLGNEFETKMMGHLTEIAEKLAFGLPPIAAITAFVILGGWAVSFLVNLIRHLRFSVTRKGRCLHIKSGLITIREHFLTVPRINLIELKQTLITKLFGFYSAYIHCNGYGKKKDELSIFMPAGERHEIRENINLLLPEIPICKSTVKPHIKYLSRFLIPPLSWIGGVFVGFFILNKLFPQFNDVILFMGIMAELPCWWYLFVKIISFLHTGVGIVDDVYTFNYTYIYKIKTIAVPKNKLIKLTIRRSLFQVMSGCCDLVILTFSEGRKRHVVPNLNFEEALEIMDAYYEDDC